MVSEANGHFPKSCRPCRFSAVKTASTRRRNHTKGSVMNIQLKTQGSTAARFLAGKVSLVTGSTSGIGLGIARALAEAGSAVVLNGLGIAAEIARTKDQFASGHGGKVSYSTADMTKPEAIAEMIATTPAQYGRLDVLVNKTGVPQFAPPAKVR